VVVAVLTWGLGTFTALGAYSSGAISGGVSGGLNAGLNGGDFNDILRGTVVQGAQGAISAGFLHGLGESAQAAGTFSAETVIHVAGHGVLGGASNAALGGKFQDGFLSAATSTFAADAGLLGAEGGGAVGIASRTIRASIIGGSASALGGGKFANGAYTAAFQHLLNEESDSLFSGGDKYGNVALNDEDITALAAGIDGGVIGLGPASPSYKAAGFLGLFNGDFEGNRYEITFPKKDLSLGDLFITPTQHSIFVDTSGGVTYSSSTVLTGSVSIGPGAARHIFRNAAGHVAPLTISSQARFIKLFQSISISTNENMAVVKSQQAISAGVTGYSKTYNFGQVWTNVRNGKIFNAGVNRIGTFR
jgi:hypothetical protein